MVCFLFIMKVFNQCEKVLTVGWSLCQLQPEKLSMALAVKGTFKLEFGSVASQFPDEPDGVTGNLHLEEDG